MNDEKVKALEYLDRAVTAVAACMAGPDAVETARQKALAAGATITEIEQVVRHR